MTDLQYIKLWSKSLPSRLHPERNEDLAWSAANRVAHAVVDGMGGVRRKVEGGEIGGENAAHIIGEVLKAHLEDLPTTLSADDAKELLRVVVSDANDRIFRELNASGQIPPDQIPEGKTAEDVMVAAVMTALIICEGGRRAVISQNGDTRCYLFSDGDLLLLTEDQDAIQADMVQGKLTPDQVDAIQEAVDDFDGHDIGKLDPTARSYFVQRNLVYGEIGDSEAPRLPDLTTIQLRPGDVLMLCSDGVYSNLTTAEIANSMSSIDPAATLVDRGDARSTERALPDPQDLSIPYNCRAHQDDATAVVVKIDW
ncbi:MAG: PP2C family protein-serine/threonine phosphatase [Chloroflexia bacterium]